MDALHTLDYLCCNRYSLYTSLIYDGRCLSRSLKVHECCGLWKCSASLKHKETVVRYPGRPMEVTFHNRGGALRLARRSDQVSDGDESTLWKVDEGSEGGTRITYMEGQCDRSTEVPPTRQDGQNRALRLISTTCEYPDSSRGRLSSRVVLLGY